MDGRVSRSGRRVGLNVANKKRVAASAFLPLSVLPTMWSYQIHRMHLVWPLWCQPGRPPPWTHEVATLPVLLFRAFRSQGRDAGCLWKPAVLKSVVIVAVCCARRCCAVRVVALVLLCSSLLGQTLRALEFV